MFKKLRKLFRTKNFSEMTEQELKERLKSNSFILYFNFCIIFVLLTLSILLSYFGDFDFLHGIVPVILLLIIFIFLIIDQDALANDLRFRRLEKLLEKKPE